LCGFHLKVLVYQEKLLKRKSWKNLAPQETFRIFTT
jgi:hypothetical protein